MKADLSFGVTHGIAHAAGSKASHRTAGMLHVRPVAGLLILLSSIVLFGACGSRPDGTSASGSPGPAQIPLVSPPDTQSRLAGYMGLFSGDTGVRVPIAPEDLPARRFGLVQKGEYFATVGFNPDFRNGIEVLSTDASREGGPFQLRLVWPAGIVFSGYLVRNDSRIRSVTDLKPGIKVGETAEAAIIRQSQIPSLMAWANVPVNQVIWVSFPTYDAMIRGLREGKIDLTYAYPTSASVGALGNTVRFLDLPAETDPKGAKRFLEVHRTAAFSKISEGPAYLVGANGQASIMALVTGEGSDPDTVYNLVKWLHSNFHRYRDLDPQNKYMTREVMQKLANTSFVPIHPGTIRFLKESGLWEVRNDARQQHNVELITNYVNSYKTALRLAQDERIPPRTAEQRWLDYWSYYKTQVKLPRVTTFLGLD